jgi:signal transduction histidine kinase
MSKAYSILYLDDEEQNLLSFQALFRRTYNVFTTSSAHEAVDILNNNEIHVIFSDQKMPDVSGVEFFETILPDFPNAVRILLTGYADIEAVIDAINKGQVYRYVAKPWDANELAICVENAIEKYHRDQKLQSQNHQLEKTNSELAQLVFGASNELKPAIESMMLSLAALENSNPTADQSQAIAQLKLQAAHLQTFAQQVSQFYQNTHAAVTMEEIDLAGLLDEIIEKLPQNLTSVAWEIVKELNVQGKFRCDRKRLSMVLQSLLINAIQYSDPAKPANTITLQVIQNTEKAVFKIEDQGKGMDQQLLDRLFSMQLQNDVHETAGVGLHLTKSAVEKLGGKISAFSERGMGTRINFELPNKL